MIIIWEEACRFIRKCEDTGICSCPVSVNVSRIHLHDNECVEVLAELINKCGITKKLLELEITETASDQQKSITVKARGVYTSYG